MSVSAAAKRALRKLRWAFANRVVAVELTVEEMGQFFPGDWVEISGVFGGELRRVWHIDNARLVISVF